MNAVVHPQGGASRRPGTQFIANELYQLLNTAHYEDIAAEKRLIPWVSSDFSFVIVLGASDGTEILYTEDAPIHAIGLQVFNTIIDGTEINTLLPSENVSWVTNYLGAAVTNKKTFKGYALADLKDVQYAQSGDTMILTHKDYIPIIIRRLAHVTANSGFFIAYPFYYYVPLIAGVYNYVPDTANFQANIFTNAAVSYPYALWPFLPTNTNTTHTMTASAATVGTARDWTSSKNWFFSDMIGSFYKVTSAAVTGLVEIESITSPTVAKVRVWVALAGTGAYTDWEESAWSDRRGWPSSVTFYQQRAIYGGRNGNIWGSKVGNFQWMDQKGGADAYATGATRTEVIQDSNGKGTITTMGYGTLANVDPFNFQPSSGESSDVRWLASDKIIVMGAVGREFLIKGPDGSQGIGPLNIDYSPETSIGSAYTQPVKAGNSLQFVQRDGQRLREFTFDFNQDSYKSEDISERADHMVRKSMSLYASYSISKIIGTAYQNSTNTTWCIDNNGALFGVTRNEKTGQIAWHFHKLGGSFSAETPKVLSLCVLPNSAATWDEVYLLVKRTVNSATKYYIERLSREFQDPAVNNSSTSIDNKPIFSDCAKLVRLGSPGLTWAGFDYLEGQTVQCVVDGSYRGTAVVASGNVVLTGATGTELIAGLSYQTIVTPLSPDAGSLIGSAFGVMKKIDKVVMQFLRTVGAKFGRSSAAADLETINMRASTVLLDAPTPLFSGQIVRDFPGDFQRNASVTIVQDDPMPMTITGFSARGVTND